MKTNAFNWTITLLTLLLFSSCARFDEGGLVRKAETRLTNGSWLFSSYYENGVDQTETVLISDYVETYREDGSMSRSFYDKESEYQLQEGNWKFIKNDEQLELSGVGSIELTNSNSTVSSSHYQIIKLDKDEFWFSYFNGGDHHEFHFVNRN